MEWKDLTNEITFVQDLVRYFFCGVNIDQFNTKNILN